MSIINRINNLPDKMIINENISEKLTKLINIKRTSQYELLELGDQDAEDLYQQLHKIDSKFKRHKKLREKLNKVQHENIPIILEGEDFI